MKGALGLVVAGGVAAGGLVACGWLAASVGMISPGTQPLAQIVVTTAVVPLAILVGAVAWTLVFVAAWRATFRPRR